MATSVVIHDMFILKLNMPLSYLIFAPRVILFEYIDWLRGVTCRLLNFMGVG